MHSRVTMAVVARQAGVHTTTVSLALRNHPSLPLATRQRLQQLAAEMGYRRDPALSALVAYRRQSRPNRSNPLLGYITHWDTRYGWKDLPAHRQFFEGCTAKAADLGYQLEHFWLGEPELSHRRMSRILYSRGIVGLIIASHRTEFTAPLDFEWSKFSAVKIDFAPRDQLLHIITNDQRTIISQAVRRVQAAGYRRIGFVMPHWWDEFVELAWSAGFLAEQQRFAAPDRIPILYYSTPHLPAASAPPRGPDYVVPAAALSAWFKTHRPEVIVSFGPFVLGSLATLGFSIPRDVAFVETFLEKTDGSIAGIRQNCRRVGELAVEILAGQLHQHVYGVPAIPTATLVEGTWYDGASLPPRRPSDGRREAAKSDSAAKSRPDRTKRTRPAAVSR
ncbi:MAG TPA: LacI family DNA-binding transcriptional regulator [Lacunisphaera sp.]|nr:LacI family DNA-binding transcriptional regulator [Lacunisphaera sp.]